VEYPQIQIDGRRVGGMHVLMIPSAYPTAVHPLTASFYADQAVGLRRAGARVGVVFPELRSLRTLNPRAFRANHLQVTIANEDGVDVVRWHGWNVPNAQARGWLFRRQVQNLSQIYFSRFGRPDILHAQNTLWGGVAAASLSEETHLPFVITEHSTLFRTGAISQRQSQPVRRALMQADRTLAVSASLASSVRRHSGPKPIVVMPNMVDAGFFTLPARPRTREPFRFLTVGHLIRRKGIDVLLRAFAGAFSERPSVSLWIGGDGPERAALQRLAYRLRLDDQVRFVGRVRREQVRELMWQCHALVISSRIETFGVVAIEAMATGMRVIATRCGGPEEVVDERLGFLVPPEDPIALRDAMHLCYETRMSATTEQQEEVRGYVAATYGAEAVSQRILAIYRDLVGERHQ
jgi:glycosyltransferase involved in cell wall biosynthesis